MTGHGRNDKSRGDVSSIINQNKVEPKKPVTRSASFQKVTYGGIDGTYYTATTSRRTGDDGVCLLDLLKLNCYDVYLLLNCINYVCQVMWEESKQADRTTGQAAHKVSRGIHDKVR